MHLNKGPCAPQHYAPTVFDCERGLRPPHLHSIMYQLETLTLMNVSLCMNDANIGQDFREINIVPRGANSFFFTFKTVFPFSLLPFGVWWNTYLELTVCLQCLSYCSLREYSWSGKSLSPSFDLSTAGHNCTAKSPLKMLSHFWSERGWVSRMLLQLCAHKVD